MKTLSLGEIQRPGDETIAQAMQWIDGLQGGQGATAGRGERFFAWVHLYDPHTPYTPPEPWKSRYPEAPYNAEIAWTDSLVGRLLEYLQARGLRDRTIVAVIGDHGEGLGDHGEVDHGFFIYRSTSWVPFLLDAPSPPPGAGSCRPRSAMRTLRRRCSSSPGSTGGLEPGQGRSLVPLLAGKADPPGTLPRAYSEIFLPRLHYGWSELRSLRRDRWHFIEAPRAELYDVEADPGEMRNLADAERRVVRELRAELAALDATVQPAASGTAPVEEDEETMRALAALGYIGGQALDTGKSFRDLPDPKDRLDVFAKMGRARGLCARRGLEKGHLPARRGAGGGPGGRRRLVHARQRSLSRAQLGEGGRVLPRDAEAPPGSRLGDDRPRRHLRRPGRDRRRSRRLSQVPRGRSEERPDSLSAGPGRARRRTRRRRREGAAQDPRGRAQDGTRRGRPGGRRLPPQGAAGSPCGPRPCPANRPQGQARALQPRPDPRGGGSARRSGSRLSPGDRRSPDELQGVLQSRAAARGDGRSGGRARGAARAPSG